MQPLKVVVGYIPRVDRLPRAPRKLGLTHRVALILDTYRPYDTDAFFDSALYEGSIAVVQSIVGADRLRLVDTLQGTHEIRDSHQLHQLLEKTPDAIREPFQRVLFLKGPAVVAIAESESWAHVGGPEPYNDSYAIAVFTASDISQLLLREIHVFATTHGGDIRETIAAAAHPIRPRAFDSIRYATKRLAKLLGRA